MNYYSWVFVRLRCAYLTKLNQASHSMLERRMNIDTVQHPNFVIRLIVVIKIYLLLSCRRWKCVSLGACSMFRLYTLLLFFFISFAGLLACLLVSFFYTAQSTTPHTVCICYINPTCHLYFIFFSSSQSLYIVANVCFLWSQITKTHCSMRVMCTYNICMYVLCMFSRRNLIILNRFAWFTSAAAAQIIFTREYFAHLHSVLFFFFFLLLNFFFTNLILLFSYHSHTLCTYNVYQ